MNVEPEKLDRETQSWFSVLTFFCFGGFIFSIIGLVIAWHFWGIVINQNAAKDAFFSTLILRFACLIILLPFIGFLSTEFTLRHLRLKTIFATKASLSRGDRFSMFLRCFSPKSSLSIALKFDYARSNPSAKWAVFGQCFFIILLFLFALLIACLVAFGTAGLLDELKPLFRGIFIFIP